MIFLDVSCAVNEISNGQKNVRRNMHSMESFLLKTSAIYNTTDLKLNSQTQSEEYELDSEECYCGFVIIKKRHLPHTSLNICHCEIEKVRHLSKLNPVVFKVTGEFFCCLMQELHRSLNLRTLILDKLEENKSIQPEEEDLPMCSFCGQKLRFIRVNIIVQWPAFPVIDKKW